MAVLRRPDTPEELEALHDLRDAVLFRGRGRMNYNRNHKDDTAPQNAFMGFWDGKNLLGTLRLDYMQSGLAAVRLVAIAPDCQRQGIGRAMMLQAHHLLLRDGYKKAHTNAARDASLFYEKLGYYYEAWPDVHTPAADSVQMTKPLD